MDMRALAERAKSQLAELTGLKPITVTGAFKDERGWHITLDMLEMSRIPTATDVLGDYEVVLDDNGNLLRFERRRTRLRGEPMEAEERV
ncbi:MAG: gas vesicle protein [Chloroflexi bacterium]|nr:gas vesicle protein [Chloroflexota bacterium]MCL5075484.1 gas vesicle protein [Chloroflexota bacterium]